MRPGGGGGDRDRQALVILEAEDAVRRFAPQLVKGETLSVARVQTTRPKYLVFGANPETPVCVVQFGASDELERLHHILQRLEPHLPALIPKAIALEPYGRGLHAHIQGGLAGAPWFRIRQECRTERRWMEILNLSVDALRQLQSAVRKEGCWTRTVSPADELRTQLQLSLRHISIPDDTVRRVNAAADSLDCLGKIESQAQHGDFALNNLLIQNKVVRIIDFDEFGMTFMPYHDETGVALSLLALAPAAVNATVFDYLAAIRQERRDRRDGAGLDEHLPALIIHHVVWRLNQSRDRRREEVKAWLVGVLCMLASHLIRL